MNRSLRHFRSNGTPIKNLIWSTARRILSHHTGPNQKSTIDFQSIPSTFLYSSHPNYSIRNQSFIQIGSSPHPLRLFSPIRYHILFTIKDSISLRLNPIVINSIRMFVQIERPNHPADLRHKKILQHLVILPSDQLKVLKTNRSISVLKAEIELVL